jgi:hypothetical protein
LELSIHLPKIKYTVGIPIMSNREEEEKKKGETNQFPASLRI